MKIGFIGCGNMGSALARAVSQNLKTEVYISDYNEEKALVFSKEIGAIKSDNVTIARECDFIFLGVKPNVVGAVLEGVRDALTENAGGILVSMAAGVTLEKIASFVGARPVIRIMPNTPVAVGCGMISWCKSGSVTDESASRFEEILSPAGKLFAIDEKLIDAATAVAGCGPAFVYMFTEALADGAVACGLPREAALTMAAQTVLGSAEMILKSGKHPEKLKDDVCSPGGSTIVGVQALEKGAFRADAAGAVIAAYEKTKKLG